MPATLGSTIAEIDYATGRVVRIPGIWPLKEKAMESPEWVKIMGAVAPALATALGGPFAGAAVAALSAKLLGRPDGTETDVAALLATGGPEVLRQVKQAEADFKVEMRKLDIEVEQLHQADRASARGREASTGDSITPRALAAAVTLGFFGVLGWMLSAGMPERGGDALLVMLGALGSAWAAVIGYYFGSSAGSARKDEMLRQG